MENRRRQMVEVLANSKENNDVIEFMCDVHDNMVKFADKHNIDRDEFIDYTAYTITELGKISTSKYYKYEVEEK